MTDFSYLPPDLLRKAYRSDLRPCEICWKPKDIRDGIKALAGNGKEIGAITIYFKVGSEVYCPAWGDCLMLEGGNDAYLELLDGLDLSREVDFEMIYQLISRFALIVPAGYDWTEDRANLKINLSRELAGYDLNEMYFCLSVEA